MDAVGRDVNKMGMERKVTDDMKDGEEPSMTIAVTSDDGTSLRKDECTLFQITLPTFVDKVWFPPTCISSSFLVRHCLSLSIRSSLSSMTRL